MSGHNGIGPGAPTSTSRGAESFAVERLLEEARSDEAITCAVVDKLGFERTRKGRTWAIRCPWHADQNPSLDSLAHKGKPNKLNCPVCDHTVDVVDLVREVRNDEFIDAVRFIADTANLTAPSVTNGHTPRTSTPKTRPPVSIEKFHEQRAERHVYRDEEGTELFATVRRIGELIDEATGEVIKDREKRIFQEQPDGRKTLGGVRLVIYRLPELRSADKSTPVFIVEGESCADRLAAEGLVVTCNPLGAGKWRDEYAVMISDAGVESVVVLSDYDEQGRKHAATVAASCSAAGLTVRVLDDINTGGTGSDVVDWLDAEHTTDELIKRASAAKLWSAENADTVEVEDDAEDDAELLLWRPFPTESLPPGARKFTRRAAKAKGVDEAFIGPAALAMISGAAGPGAFRVEPHGKSWQEPIAIWALLVAKSGTNKSAALDMVVEPLNRAERRARAQHANELRELEARGHEDADEPMLRRYVTSDATIEALGSILADTPRGVLMHRDEASGWVGGFARYTGSKDGEAAQWCELHGAGTLRSDRKTVKSLYVPNAAVSIVGGVQPGVLDRTIATEAMTELGLLGRFLLVRPPTRPVKLREQKELDAGTAADWNGLIEALVEHDPIDDGEGPRPHVLRLSEDATERFVSWWDDEHAEAQADAEGAIASFFGKLRGFTLRLAGVDHLVRVARGDSDLMDPIAVESVERAIVLSEWFLHEARRVLAGVEAVAADQRLDEVLDLAVRRGGVLSTRDLSRANRKFGTTEHARQFIGKLVSRGRAEWLSVGTHYTDSNGEKRTVKRSETVARFFDEVEREV